MNYFGPRGLLLEFSTTLGIIEMWGAMGQRLADHVVLHPHNHGPSEHWYTPDYPLSDHRS